MIRWDISDPDGRSGEVDPGVSGISVEAWRESALALRLEWEFLDYSTFLPPQKHAAGDLVLQVAEIHQKPIASSVFACARSTMPHCPPLHLAHIYP